MLENQEYSQDEAIPSKRKYRSLRAERCPAHRKATAIQIETGLQLELDRDGMSIHQARYLVDNVLHPLIRIGTTRNHQRFGNNAGIETGNLLLDPCFDLLDGRR